MTITKTENREVRCELDVQASDGFNGVILIEREASGPKRKRMKRSWSQDGVSLSNGEFTKTITHGVQALKYCQMAEIVRAIGGELKRRNPIGVNMYTRGLLRAYGDLMEISGGEAGNFTSECGPKE
jgi:hypothetical protein